jgi:UDP-N-acetylglucosamine 2-epimerase (non-hydrolysing)
MKLLFVFGTRPEAIKLAPVIKEALQQPESMQITTCITAQHREMLDQVIELFELPVDYDLNIMTANQSIFDVTTRVLSLLKDVLETGKPDIVITQGDTTTTFAASLAAFYLKIPVGHVEAGLRTNNKYHPFPEEINRRLTTQIADLHFAPTEKARQNLLAEAVPVDRIFITGNTVIDALKIIIKQQMVPGRLKAIEKSLLEKTGLSINQKRLILVTSHRRENYGQGFENICYALKEIAANNSDIQVIYPVHFNPNVRTPVQRILSGFNNIHLIEPLEYTDFVYLMNKSYIILTDSGGIQEEAPALGKPVLVMREVTERPEAIEAGTAKLVGTNKDMIVRQTQLLLDDHWAYQEMSRAHNPYGDGNASVQILNVLKKHFAPSYASSELNYCVV